MVKWLENVVFYEIYPQSFKDTNSDGIGDLQGIIEKLDYIQELGCNAIWINPCFEAVFGDAGYDVTDFYSVAPRYGTNEDLKRLFDEVHKRDMHILLDLVAGHTSIEHKWFKESQKDEKNEFTNRYIWTDSIWQPPGEMHYIRGVSERDGCCAVNYYSCQSALNYGFYNVTEPWQYSYKSPEAKEMREELKNIMRFWHSMGCDGFHVDMVFSLVKNDPNSIGTIALWQDIREFLEKEYPEAVMVSEWGEPNKSIQGGFHMDFLLHFGPSHYNDLFRCEEPFFSKRGRGDISDFVNKYIENYAKAGDKGLICIPSGNHDMDRLARRLDADEMKITFAFLLSMPGVPFIYYGDEIGMRYIENLRSVEGGYYRTGSRSPMQWDSTSNAGFSAAPKEKLYIRQDSDRDRPTVEKQINDEKSLLNEVKKLIKIRRSEKALQSRGKIEFVYAEKNTYPLAYIRANGDSKILIILNPSAREMSFNCEYEIKEAIYNFGKRPDYNNGKIVVPGQSAEFYRISSVSEMK